MEIYEPDGQIMSYPVVTDYSMDLRQIVHYFGRSYRNHCTSCVNRYLFSIGNDFVCIVPIRTQFRVIGRCDSLRYIKRCRDYDVYYVGSFEDCRSKFLSIVSDVLHFADSSPSVL